MRQPPAPKSIRWPKYLFVAAAAVVVVIQFCQLAHKPRGDFPNHWEFGRRMASGEFIYEGGLNNPYPPLWSLAHAPLTVVPKHAAQLLVFPLIFAAAVLLFWVLNQLTVRHWPLSQRAAFWTVALTLVLAGRWMIRDMVECGVNLALVALSWLAVYLWTQRKEWLGGTCLGLAGALKCTPLAFLAYFLWKRQWKMALATTVATTLFTLAPAIWMGPQQYAKSMSVWFTYTSRGLAQPDPSRGVLGEEKVQNHSLRPALARVLMHIPAGHKLRSQHAWHGDILNLPPKTAGLVIKGLMLVIALVVAWRFRRGCERDSPTVLWECAGISLAILLYSPITWSQHCVGVLPLMYLMVRSAVSEQHTPRWVWPVAVIYICFVVALNRTIVGREFTLLLLSYHVYTWCFLTLLATTIAYHCRSLTCSAKDSDKQKVDAWAAPESTAQRSAA